MQEKLPLGKLISVDPRAQWLKEDTEFTPWLAEPDNLKLLGQVVGMDLELIEAEAKVGPYRADIFCRDNSTDSYVLIENQLEPTDHLHLGQLMTYAAGLETVRIIWVAKKFNEEHRAALDWLNRITTEEFQFFGIEIELWKIDDSKMAPRLNLVAKPNDWSKAVKTKKEANWSERSVFYRQLWSDLFDFLRENYSEISLPNLTGLHWIRFPMQNHSRCVLSYSSTQKKLSIYLLFRSDCPKGWFKCVRDNKTEIDQLLAKKFEWEINDDDTGAAEMAIPFDHTDQNSKLEAYKLIGDALVKINNFLSTRNDEFQMISG